ncbi:MAG: glycosyl transferase [Chloroflexi bacterium]|nr:glycosyl transferase [Chloroflexota bacterium]|tara:strand:- start:46 stop:798 length:753 start_codon:yes stop_codon:yes gene_type:complete
MSIKASVFIITKNEERFIERALKSVSQFDEVILVDSGSTDKTLEIAKKYNAKIFSKEWQGFSKQKQYAMSLCKNDWVLNLDADEEIGTNLINELKKIIREDKVDGVRLMRNDLFINKFPSKLIKKNHNLRFYKKSKASFNKNKLVHESATINGNVILINHAFKHFGYNSIEILNKKNNDYSSLKAEEKYNKKIRFSIIRLLLVFPATFIKEYIIHRKMFSGIRGFILSVMNSYYAFIKEAKLFEKYEEKN